MRNILIAAVVIGASATHAVAGSFVNWENAHVHPLDITPDATRLLAVNTPDNRLEVFDIAPNGALTWTGSVPVGIDPVTVRARSNNEVWVANHISDTVSIVSLATMNVVATIPTLDEPADIVFAGTTNAAFISCSQANKIMVFDTANLNANPTIIPINGEDPRAMAVSPDGAEIYVAIFESGNASTVLNGGHGLDLNRVVNNSGPYGGVNPPPNGPNGTFVPPVHPNNPPPPAVGLIVKKNDLGQWLDDNAEDWTEWVSGPSAPLSNRPVGWDMPDRDIAVINADTKTVTGHFTRFMNILMAIGVNPANGNVATVGTDATNEIRFEPNINGTFIRVHVGLIDPADDSDPPVSKIIKDLNPHLDYSTSTVAAAERNKSIGDPRAIVWESSGARGFISGMGSNNVAVINANGTRDMGLEVIDFVEQQPVPILQPGSSADLSRALAGGIDPQPVIKPAIEVGQGPTGLVLDETRAILYVLNKFDATVSVVPLANLKQRDVVPFYDPSPTAIKAGRRHLYNTHATSGLGQASCASCHVDARMDRIGWDLGAPDIEIEVGGILDQNLGAGIPGFTPSTVPPGLQFQDWHTMKGPMTTQTFQDIIDQEPFHWRGDRFGLEEFNGAFESLLGDDEQLDPTEMQQFEDFLATIHFPPNPFRNLDNTLPTSLPLDGHFATGRFAGQGGLPPGAPLPPGDAINGMDLYRLVTLDGFTCMQCHSLPTGMGPDMEWDGAQWQPFPTGPEGEHHRMLFSGDAQSNRTIKVPQLRNMYEKTGFNFTKLENAAGFGFLHDGTIDSIEHFVGLGAFNVQNDQEIADLTALMLAFSGSDFPPGDPNDVTNPPGGPSKDTHAAVGKQTTVSSGVIPIAQDDLITQLLALADLGVIDVTVKGIFADEHRGFAYRPDTGATLPGHFQSDRVIQLLTIQDLREAGGPGSELTWTAVAIDTEIRIGIDRDEDTFLDRDEIDAGSDPADPASTPPPFCPGDIDGDSDTDVFDFSILAQNFGRTDLEPFTGGDLDGDGDVDVFDFTILSRDFGCYAPPPFDAA